MMKNGYGETATLFSHAEGQRLRNEGMMAASYSYGAQEWLEKARDVALMLIAKHSECTIDDVLHVLPRPESVRPNAIGSVFRDKRFRCLGFTESTQVQRHCGMIRRWGMA